MLSIGGVSLSSTAVYEALTAVPAMHGSPEPKQASHTFLGKLEVCLLA